MLPGCRKEPWIRTANRACCPVSSGHLFFLLLCFMAFDVCEGLPAMSSTAVSQAVDFLTKFGYLPQSDLETGNLRTESQLKEAIKTMQKFGNIPQTGVIDDATLELMSRKRCGMPDLIGTSERVKRYALQGQKWQKTNLTWSIKRPVPIADVIMIRRQFDKAFRVWSDASKLTFQEIASTDADIVISFLHGSHGDGYPFDGRGSVLAHAFFPGEGIGGDAHFDAEEFWISGEPKMDSDGVNLFSVAAHEFGHSLGLSHSSVAGSLMFPYYQGVQDNFQLPYDDRVGIQQLYGARNPTRWATLPPVKGPTKPPITTKKPPKKGPHTQKPIPPKAAPTRSPTKKPKIKPSFSIPDSCNTTFDAISVIRTEVFAFKNRYFWRFNEKQTRTDYPVAIDRFWFKLPPDLKRVDAIYERPVDTKIVFFSGKQYWLFDANYPLPGYPRPLTDLGLPRNLEKIDAAMVWGHNGKTYFFSGKQYWRYEEFEGRVEPDYPRDMAMWRGVPYNIDSAFQWSDGKTYFFKGKYFWKFDDLRMRAEDRTPGQITNFWFDCPSSNEKLPESDSQYSDYNKGVSSSLDRSKIFMTFALLVATFRWLNSL